MALLTLQYTAPLPAGFTSGTVEVKSGAVYIDASGRVNQPYRKYTLNADKSLTSLQGDATPVIVGMAMGDPATAGVLDVIVTHNVTGLPTAQRSTFQIVPVDITGAGTLNLHAPSLTAPVIGPYSPTLQALIDGATGQQAAVATAITGTNAARDNANAVAAAVPGTVATALVPVTQALADNAQATALAIGVAGIVSKANLAAITGADGYYRAMDTGYVYQRTAGTNTRRADLEPTVLRSGTNAQRLALTAGGPLSYAVLFSVTNGALLRYVPGVGWLDPYGGDPDAAAPPPDTGRLP
jgi:hypothetical protein